MKRISPYVLACSITWAGCLTESAQPYIEGHDVKVTFIHTSDIHSRILPYALQVTVTDESLGLNPSSTTVGGAARATSIIKRIRSQGGRVVHIDTGDLYQGAPVFNLFLGEVEFKWFSMLGVDAMAIGNHEFDAGMANFVKQAREFGRFPLLNGNYLPEDPNVDGASEFGKIARPYTIINAQGLRIGVIGMGSLSSIVSMYQGGNSLGITPLDTIQAVQFWVDYLRPLVDVVVVATHIGLRGEKKFTRGEEDQIDDCEGENCQDDPADTESCNIVHRLIGDEQIIRNTEGIDVLLGGHLHIVINPPEVIRDCDPNPACAGQPFYEELMRRGCRFREREVPLMHSGAFLKFIGQLDVVFHKPDPAANETEADRAWRELNGWEVKTFRPSLHPVDDSVPCRDWDIAVERMLGPYRRDLHQQIQLGRYIAYAPKKIRRFATGFGDSPLGNLVSNAIQTRNRVEAHFAVTNTFGIRTDFDRGPITIEMMFNVFPFENQITTMTLSGQEVQDLMDYSSLRSARRGCNSQVQIAGVTMYMDCNTEHELARRVTIGGSRLSDPATFGTDVDGRAICDYDGMVCDNTAGCQGANCCPDRLRPAMPCPSEGEIGNGSCCPSGEICTPLGCGSPISTFASYKLATNDYIANGGSGFTILEQNTTQFNTGISLRDAVIDYVNSQFPGCGEDLPDQTRSQLDTLYQAFFEADGSSAGYESIVGQVEAFYAGATQHPNYSSCVADLGERVAADCEYMVSSDCRDQVVGEIPTAYSRCRAESWLRAADMCVGLPCVQIEEDGRIVRIFPGQ